MSATAHTAAAGRTDCSERPENATFRVKDCALITRMAGISSAINLRELRERIQLCPVETLYHHFCETSLRATFDDPEFRNDFAVWAARHVGDRVLAERFGIVNPYVFASLDELRETLVDLLDERLSEVATTTWRPASEEFRFLQAATVVFDTGVVLASPRDLSRELPEMSRSAIYYHFVEARRRLPQKTDDFSFWLECFGEETRPMREALSRIDFYFLSLAELKTELVRATRLPEEAA